MKSPIVIPKDVLAILREDKMVRNTLEYEHVSTEKLPSSWFSASSIHLGDPGAVDIVVEGEALLSGANVTTFWVFCATPRGYELTLTAPAHDLIVRNTRSKGYREIEMSAETAADFSSVLFRFDGKRYKAFRQRTTPIP